MVVATYFALWEIEVAFATARRSRKSRFTSRFQGPKKDPKAVVRVVRGSGNVCAKVTVAWNIVLTTQ